jgi:hypothetical protein
MRIDFYVVLGILPDAEDVVIKAAYRALAQRYHPDRWVGDAAEAHQRMTRINQAYEVLGDKARRAAYDKGRARSQAEYSPDEEGDRSEAFTSALNEVDKRWGTAYSIFPDLVQLRARLARINTSLAFSFVTSLLESKGFTKREAFAEHLEQAFLERHFGSNKEILNFVRILIFSGNRAAVKELNQLIDVMGSDVDPSLLIQRIEKKFGGPQAPMEIDEGAKRRAVFLESGDTWSARFLAEYLGYKVDEISKGFFTPNKYRVSKNKVQHDFDGDVKFIEWVRKNLCSD